MPSPSAGLLQLFSSTPPPYDQTAQHTTGMANQPASELLGALMSRYRPRLLAFFAS